MIQNWKEWLMQKMVLLLGKHLNRLEKRANRDLSHEDPQREMQRPILGQDKAHLPTQAEDVAAEKLPCRKGPGALLENKLALQEGQQHHVQH